MTSIRRTITRSLAAAVLLVCATTFLLLFLLIRAKLIQQFDLSLRSMAETIAGLVQVDHGRLELDERDEALTEFRRTRHASYFEVIDSDGNALLRSASLAQPLAGIPCSAGSAEAIPLPDGRRGRAIALKITPREEAGDDEPPRPRANVAPVTVVVARDSANLESTLRWMAAALALAVAVLLGVLLLVTPRLVFRGLRPLDRLSERAAALDARNLATRFPTDSMPAELRPIGVRLNESLDRIAEAFARERRFAADAAHELRTPLAAIRANAEVALKWPEPQQMKSSLADIVTSAARLGSLLERLLELARLGNRSSTAETKPIELAAFLRDRIQKVPDSSRIALDAASSIGVQTQPEFLTPLVDNVLANAVDHSPAGSRVSVSLIANPHPTICVTNAAPDLVADDLPKMYNPLWTKSSDRSAGHAGLGLALVAEYARSLGVTLDSRLNQGGEFSFLIIFDSHGKRGRE